MTSTRRALAILASAGVAVLLSSCGVKAGQSDASGTTAPGAAVTTTSPKADTTTTAPKELSSEDQAVVDSITKTYTDLGFTEKEASCLANGMMANGGSTTDMSAIMDVVNQCDIPVSRFSDIQKNLGGGSTAEIFKKSLVAGFSNMGLTKKQADCVADAYVEKFGTSPGASSDTSSMMGLFETCNVDPSDFKLGG